MQEVDVCIGGTVTYVDPQGRRHPALVTAIHGFTSKEARDASYDAEIEKVRSGEKEAPAYYGAEKWIEHYEAAKSADFVVPSINVVYVTADESKTDPYGTQIERATSVGHRQGQTAHGYYWE